MEPYSLANVLLSSHLRILFRTAMWLLKEEPLVWLIPFSQMTLVHTQTMELSMVVLSIVKGAQLVSRMGHSRQILLTKEALSM